MERRKKEIVALTTTTVSFILLIAFLAVTLVVGFDSVAIGSVLVLTLFIVWVGSLVAAITYSKTGWELDGFKALEYLVLAIFIPLLPLALVLTSEDQKEEVYVDPDNYEQMSRL